MPLRTRHQAECAWIQAAAYESTVVAAGQTIGDGFDGRRSRSRIRRRSAGGSKSADRIFHPNNGTTGPTMSPEHPVRFSLPVTEILHSDRMNCVGNRSGWCLESIRAGGLSRTARRPWDA